MKTASAAPPREAEMLCWLALCDLECVFLEENEGSPMKPVSPAPPREAEMLCWLALCDLECIFLGEY